MRTKIIKSYLTGLLITFALVSCGGGDDPAATPTPPPTPSVLTGTFVDAPVMGLNYQAGSTNGVTNTDGHFNYMNGESVTFSVGSITLGTSMGKSIVTPFDLSTNDAIVKAIASLLQSLDSDPTDNIITISPSRLAALEAALGGQINLALLVDDPDTLVNEVEDALLALDIALQAVAADAYVPPSEALIALISNLTQVSDMTRNISKTPEALSDKAGVEIMAQPVAARDASGTLLDGYGTVKPIVNTYADAVGPNGEFDAFAAVSYDNGATWKRINLSRIAGQGFNIGPMPFTATASGPSMHVEDNYILVSWISTYCRSPDFVVDGTIPATAENPAKTILAAESLFDPATDTAVTDLFKVLGSQGTVDYSAAYPSVGVVPYHCVWTARAVLDVDGSIGAASGICDDTTGQIIWYLPEQVTSGVRDAKLDWPAGLAEQGFGAVWQEDPEGLLPGLGEGPGVGWSGATTHHTTDIWYSYLRWDDFTTLDPDFIPSGSSEVCRPKPLVTMSVPVPVSDNISCNTDASSAKLVCTTETYCATTTTLPTQGGDSTGTFCVVDYDDDAGTYTENVDAVLDGDTGASRPNLHFAPVLDETDPTLVVGARALVMYEESKGLCELGNGCKDSELYPYDTGKFVRYHHMPDFAQPQMVNQGAILSSPVTVATSDPFDPGASYTPDPELPLYENARRERFVLNEDPAHPVKLVVIYKQGWFNQGERADIFMRRAVGGYDIENFTEDACVSCVTPENVELVEDGTAYTPKVETWSWTPANVADESWTNVYDDARSLRAQLSGDRLLIGFAWTPNWQLATNYDSQMYFKDHYDFYVRRSFDGGATFTDVAGNGQAPVNVSWLENNHESVVEPRVAVIDGSNLVCSKTFNSLTGFDEYNGAGCAGGSDSVTYEQLFVVTFCTAENKERTPVGGIPVHAPGLDCYYSWTTDNGETYVAPTKEVTVPDGSGGEVTLEVPDFDCLACDSAEEVEPEVVLTEGSSFADTDLAGDHADVIAEMHAVWVKNGELGDGSDMQNGSDSWYGLFELKPDTEEEPVPTP